MFQSDSLACAATCNSVNNRSRRRQCLLKNPTSGGYVSDQCQKLIEFVSVPKAVRTLWTFHRNPRSKAFWVISVFTRRQKSNRIRHWIKIQLPRCCVAAAAAARISTKSGLGKLLLASRYLLVARCLLRGESCFRLSSVHSIYALVTLLSPPVRIYFHWR